jgi:glyceraldehyde 3-phosphate dehydrogenase
MIRILDDALGIETAFFTTIHAYTGDQNIHDAPHRDLRRARAAALSIIPTTTGAAKAVTDVMPQLDGKLGGAAMRVPVPVGSITDLTCVVKKNTTIDAVNEIFRKASEGDYAGIIEFATDPLVSSDIVGNRHSCIFDSELTQAMGNTVKVVGWYDNETGYSYRLADLVERVGRLL